MWLALIIHVYLILLAAIAFYWLLIDVLNKHGANPHGIRYKAVIALSAPLIASGIDKFIIPGYFRGDLGFVTTAYPAPQLVPHFALIREFLMPFVILVALAILILVWKHADTIAEKPKIKQALIVLMSVGWFAASALVFLSILVP